MTINVAAVNDAPTAASTTPETDLASGWVTGSVIASDIDGDAVQYSVSGPAAKGLASVDSSGAWIYKPSTAARAQAGFTSAPSFDDTHDEFTIIVRDQHGGSVSFDVAVEVTPPDNGFVGSIDVGTTPSGIDIAPGALRLRVIDTRRRYQDRRHNR